MYIVGNQASLSIDWVSPNDCSFEEVVPRPLSDCGSGGGTTLLRPGIKTRRGAQPGACDARGDGAADIDSCAGRRPFGRTRRLQGSWLRSWRADGTFHVFFFG